MKFKAFLACSLDGFIASENDGLDWLPVPEFPEDGDFGYSEFFSSVNAVLMGRRTYEVVAGFDTWGYDKPVYVLTSSPEKIKPVNKDVIPVNIRIEKLKDYFIQKGYNAVYADGGKTVCSLINAGLLSEITISVIPVILGNGMPLFENVIKTDLASLETKVYKNGIIQTRYSVKL